MVPSVTFAAFTIFPWVLQSSVRTLTMYVQAAVILEGPSPLISLRLMV